MVPVFKNVGERCTAKNYCPGSLLSVVSKVFEKLVNNKIFDPLEKCGLFSDFQYYFRSSRSTARVFSRSGATRAVALDISDAEDNTSDPLNRRGIADLPLMRTLLAIPSKSREPSFWAVMDSVGTLGLARWSSPQT